MNKSLLIVGNFLSEHIGTRFYCEDLAVKLREANWQVITTSDRFPRFQRIWDQLSTTWGEKSRYTVATVDVYSGLSFIWAEATTWLLHRLNKPYVLALHGGNLPNFSKRYPGRVRRLLHTATAVTTPSRYIKEGLADMREDIIWLPNGIDLKHYTFQQREQIKPSIGWLRAFSSIYSPHVAVQAVGSLHEEYPDIHLTMYGPDKGDGSFQKTQHTAKELGLGEHVSLPGRIPKTSVPEHLAKHDIFVNTTTAESFGVSVVEAAALGMCIVTTNVGELPYLWHHEHNALLVPPNDPQALADAIRRLLEEPELAQKLSKNARTTAEAFDWEHVTNEWETLLIQVIQTQQ